MFPIYGLYYRDKIRMIGDETRIKIRYLQKSDKLFNHFIFTNEPSTTGTVIFKLN
jgi:hypothetical protein